MSELTEDKIIKLDIKIIILLVTLIITTAGGWWSLTNKVDTNSQKIAEVVSHQKEHVKEYQQQHQSVTKLTVTVETIEKNTQEIKETLEYMRRQSDQK